MAKRKQQYELEKNLEYGGIEHQQISPNAKKWFEHDAYKPWIKKELPRHTVTSYLESKGHDVKGVIADGQEDS